MVNRKVLKEQMKKDILSLSAELAAYITVELYQSIENASLNLSKQPYEPAWQLGFKNALSLTGMPEERQQPILNQQKLYPKCYCL